MDLREYMVLKGATKSQLESSTLKMCEQALLTETGIIDETAKSLIIATDEKTIAIGKQIDESRKKLDENKRNIAKQKKEIDELHELLHEDLTIVKRSKLSDEIDREALKVYKEALLITKAVFGDNMPEEAIANAIKTAGYITWALYPPNGDKTKTSNGWKKMYDSDDMNYL